MFSALLDIRVSLHFKKEVFNKYCCNTSLSEYEYKHIPREKKHTAYGKRRQWLVD